MPQMSPMSWVLILFMLITFMLTTMSSMSFFKVSCINKKSMAKKGNPMKW